MIEWIIYPIDLSSKHGIYLSQIRKANEKGVRFDERTIWKYFSQIATAIDHMHKHRIMHRDIKPANIFLTLAGVVKVGDLG